MNPRSSAPCVLCYRLVRTTAVTNRRHYHALTRRKIVVTGLNGTRNIAFVARVIRGVLKLRYLVLGSAVGGGYQLTKKFDEWKDGLPDFKWMHDVMPDQRRVDQFNRSLIDLRDKFTSDNSVLSNVSNRIIGGVDTFSQWLEEAREARRLEKENFLFHFTAKLNDDFTPNEAISKNPPSLMKTRFFTTDQAEPEEFTPVSERERLQEVQQELMRLQRKYQKEMERLEKDNKLLKQQLLVVQSEEGKKPKKNVKKSLIDMYSEVLDELSGYDTTYEAQDHLPRVIVVGDQSAGKTSCLEMIAQARIFPRGAGEMMTRAPVKVTLSEGPNHVARFNNSARVYDLTKESELADLRDEIEIRMASSVRGGKSISSEVISLTVQGPGIKRMVLVDLPGVISTVTSEMSKDTREAIAGLTKAYMSNPNAIILCIQDGSVDAERSIITDLVSQMDPQGKRTIFVLTKVDIAEKNMTNPGRIKKILDGKLFPMKALGYFAVVTGKGRKNDSIDEIQAYEQEFFRKSRLCKDGILTASQCTTQNLSLAVSECFWKMVKSSVEEQAEIFKKTQFNLEVEWKNQYPFIRELSRDELFERGRGILLDDFARLTNHSPKQWESTIVDKFWKKISNYVFERIYLPSAQTSTSGTFNTQVDINLKHWIEGSLSRKAIEVGWEALQQELLIMIEKGKKETNHDPVFDHLKKAVCEEAIRKHRWEENAAEILKVIQVNALEDRIIPDQIQWYSAVTFLEKSLNEKLQETARLLREVIGPDWIERWSSWTWRTEEEYKKVKIKHQLEKLVSSNNNPKNLPTLSTDEIMVVRKNLEAEGLTVDVDSIKQVWFLLFRQYFLEKALQRATNCRGNFQTYNRRTTSSSHGDECSDVIVFWRIQQMMKTTANALRQQIMNVESRRLEREIREILDDFGSEEDTKKTLLTGRRVQLAEELKKVREIREKLDVFIQALNREQ